MNERLTEGVKQLSGMLTRLAIAPVRGLGLERVANARELGGLATADGRVIRQGKLLRTAHLNDASDEDVRRLEEEYGLRLIVDLRTTMEQTVIPDREVQGSERLSCSLMDAASVPVPSDGTIPDGMDGVTLMVYSCRMPQMQEATRRLYLDIVSDPGGRERLSRAVHAILDTQGATVLWHCTQGKDRCGLLAVILLSLLGADRETILEDFMESDRVYSAMVQGMTRRAAGAGLDERSMETLRALIGVSRENMELALDWIDERYGSMDVFLEEGLAVTREERERLRGYYLEPKIV